MATSISPPTTTLDPGPTRILIINPNTTDEMTTALSPAVDSLSFPPSIAEITYWTCPSPGVPSINSPSDAAASAEACIPHLKPLLASYDAFLVAGYSEHPLVRWLAQEIENETATDTETSSSSPSDTETSASSASSTVQQPKKRKYATGILEASLAASLSFIRSLGGDAAFGIVSTGEIWQEALADAVKKFLGVEQSSSVFLGCETTGIAANQLQRLPEEEVNGKMMEAAGRLVERGEKTGKPLRAVCLGCAGMVGMEEAVREELLRRMGDVVGGQVRIIDGTKAGVGELLMLARGGF